MGLSSSTGCMDSPNLAGGRNPAPARARERLWGESWGGCRAALSPSPGGWKRTVPGHPPGWSCLSGARTGEAVGRESEGSICIPAEQWGEVLAGKQPRSFQVLVNPKQGRQGAGGAPALPSSTLLPEERRPRSEQQPFLHQRRRGERARAVLQSALK